MISVRAPDGDRTIAAISIRTPDGDVNIANASILTPDGSRVLWSAGGTGGFAVELDPLPVWGAAASGAEVTVTTQQCTATPTGGTAPFTYLWEKTSGSADWSIVSPTAQSTAFRCAELPPEGDSTATFQVTVTDARGRVATPFVTAIASNYGGLSGGV